MMRVLFLPERAGRVLQALIDICYSADTSLDYAENAEGKGGLVAYTEPVVPLNWKPESMKGTMKQTGI